MIDQRYSRIRHLIGNIRQDAPKPLSAQFAGKRQLLEALLLDAIRTFYLLLHARKPGEQQRFQEAEAWITSADTEYVFSFVNVCALLGLNADAVRTHLLCWKASQSPASAQTEPVLKGQLRIIQR